jgi:hypothetical protein
LAKEADIVDAAVIEANEESRSATEINYANSYVKD